MREWVRGAVAVSARVPTDAIERAREPVRMIE
jgi:hypothetical protein